MSFRKTGITQMHSCDVTTCQTVHIIENYSKVSKALDSQEGTTIQLGRMCSLLSIAI